MPRYALELVVFFSGACVMVLELTGARLLAPYLGTSIFVWTSLIGIILASLSLGYWWGGRLSDSRPNTRVLALLLFVSGIWTGLLALWGPPLVEAVVRTVTEIRASSVVAAILLFAVPSVLMGMVSPYVVRLKMTTVDSSGRTVGNLYAISTIGSIVGTFLAGFVLIAYLSNTTILVLIAAVLVGISFLADPRALLPARAATAAVIGLAVGFHPSFLGAGPARDVLDVNTLYSRAWVYDKDMSQDSGEPVTVRFMRIGNENSGAMFLNHWGLVYDYTEFFLLSKHFKPDFQNTLMIGGGAYSFPSNYLHLFPEPTMDVVEIDPKVTELARDYFFLQDEDPRLTVFHEDGRVFLNRNTKEYDVIFVDAFKSYYDLPHHLVTREALTRMSESLVEDGAVLANLLCVMEGEGSDLFRAVFATFQSVFPQVYVFPVQDAQDGTQSQNVMLVALKSPEEVSFVSDDPELAGYLSHRWTRPVEGNALVLTDNYSPVERFVRQAFPKATRPLDRVLEDLKDTKKPTASTVG